MSVGQYVAYAFGLGAVVATLTFLILAWRADISGADGGGKYVFMWSAAAVAAFFFGGLAMRLATKDEGIKWPDWPFVQMSKWGGEDDDDDFM
jgi:hypothetical protein